MKILVTGGNGFIGSYVVNSLVEGGYKVVIVDSSIGNKNSINKKVKCYQLNITDKNLSNVFDKERPDAVIHMAAQVDVSRSVMEPIMDAEVNILGTINVLNECVKYKVKKVVYSSTSAVYGENVASEISENEKIMPISFYGISKYTPELYLEAFFKIHGLKYTILRYSNVYGERQGIKGEGGVIPIFIHELMEDRSPVIFGDGKQTRDFIYAGDVAEANVSALNAADMEVLNISSGISITILQLFEQIRDLMGKAVTPNFRGGRSGDILHSRLANSKAIMMLSWEPKVNLPEGLRKTIDYYKEIKLQ
ncbi:NAD-dependent epimerase/dehydratase family protein [Bacillus sp. SG-1]|uniref:NAD-dependent epimerase/dehydratase family protein n=1 Tax=Bacillus sp. SG-1 TaxID=161544 RepID=UPI0001543570|nr:NAD-dependent epimerase/dehydratase family protein [Bacillus sp. SG-1]EDL65262.1 UDP-glucose 4-epimerase [Bacillus sp. SG-1]